MRLVFLGTGEFGGPTLRALHEAGHQVRAALSQPDRPTGRGLQRKPTAIHVLADQLQIPHLQTGDVNDARMRAVFDGAELGVVVAFGQKLGPSLIVSLPHGFVNLHGSLLPKFRGAAPVQWAIIEGESITGVTLFQIDERWDAGPILGTRETPIGETETAAELHDRLAVLGAELAVETISRIAAGTLQPRPQDTSRATRAPKLSRGDSAVDFGNPAFRVQRRIHGLWSWPAAACLLDAPGREPLRLQLARAERVDETSRPDASFPPGAFRDDGTVQCAPGRLRLLEVRPAGSRLMRFADFARGHDVRPPTRLRAVEER